MKKRKEHSRQMARCERTRVCKFHGGQRQLELRVRAKLELSGQIQVAFWPRQRHGATEGFLKKQDTKKNPRDTDRFEKNPLAEMWRKN